MHRSLLIMKHTKVIQYKLSSVNIQYGICFFCLPTYTSTYNRKNCKPFVSYEKGDPNEKVIYTGKGTSYLQNIPLHFTSWPLHSIFKTPSIHKLYANVTN